MLSLSKKTPDPSAQRVYSDVLGVYCGEYLPSSVDGAPLAVGTVILESNRIFIDSRGSSVGFLSFGRTIDLVVNWQYACLSECLSFSIIDKHFNL